MIYSRPVHLMERGPVPFTEKGTTSTPIPAPDIGIYRVSTPPGQSGHRFYWRHGKPNNEAMNNMIQEPDSVPGFTDNNHQAVSTRRNRDMKTEVSTKQYSYFNQSMYCSPQPKSGRFTRSPSVVNIR
jgi:hypothetical protein